MHINSRRLGNYPKESIQHTEHGESLKSRINKYFCLRRTYWCWISTLFDFSGGDDNDGAVICAQTSLHKSIVRKFSIETNATYLIQLRVFTDMKLNTPAKLKL